MKLYELHGYKKYQGMTLGQISAEMLSKHGHKTASGAYAVTIIPKTKDYVYRLYTRDAGYDAFLKFLVQHKGKHFVKVLKVFRLPMAFKRATSFGDYVMVAKLEKLEKLQNVVAVEIVNGLWQYFKSDEGEKAIPKFKVGDILENISDILIDDGDDEAVAEEARAFVRKNSDFFESYLEMYRLAVKLKMEGDLHGANVMRRANGEMVITDPLSDFMSADNSGSLGMLYDMSKDNNDERIWDEKTGDFMPVTTKRAPVSK